MQPDGQGGLTRSEPGSGASPAASVVIPSWNGRHLLSACLDSLAHQTYQPLEVVVADGGSRDGTVGWLAAAYPWARVVAMPRNRGFAGNTNAGLRAARGEVLLTLNNDAQAEPDWVATCVAALARSPSAGSVASKMLLAATGRVNSAGDGLRRDGSAFQRGAGEPDDGRWDTAGEVFGASGGAAAFRRAMLEDVGLFDEGYFAYLEDVDLAFRAHLRGWTCVYEPAARVIHLGSATGGGPLASYYNGRNGIRLLAKNLPSGLLPRLLPGILRCQARRFRAAAAAWRGAAARATMRGQLAGLATLPAHLAARRPIQRGRRVSDAHVLALLAPAPDAR